MTKPGAQVLLPPERFSSSRSTGHTGLFRWLFEPIEDRMFLPLAGLWILGLDWLLFPPEAATVFLATPLASFLGFILGSVGVYRMQRRLALDSKREALGKALLAGCVVGLPFSLAGTVVGAWIVGSSGLLHLRDRLFGRRK